MDFTGRVFTNSLVVNGIVRGSSIQNFTLSGIVKGLPASQVHYILLDVRERVTYQFFLTL